MEAWQQIPVRRNLPTTVTRPFILFIPWTLFLFHGDSLDGARRGSIFKEGLVPSGGGVSIGKITICGHAVEVDRPCTEGDGIHVLTNEDREVARAAGVEVLQTANQCSRFVPASGPPHGCSLHCTGHWDPALEESLQQQAQAFPFWSTCQREALEALAPQNARFRPARGCWMLKRVGAICPKDSSHSIGMHRRVSVGLPSRSTPRNGVPWQEVRRLHFTVPGTVPSTH